MLLKWAEPSHILLFEHLIPQLPYACNFSMEEIQKSVSISCPCIGT